jgi:hypothetical protein
MIEQLRPSSLQLEAGIALKEWQKYQLLQYETALG